MNIIARTGREELAFVYLADLGNGTFTEFVESIQPPFSREDKWVLIVSSLNGCPVGCLMCDAGGWYQGRLTRDEILAQIDYMVEKRFPDRMIPVRKFKIQFARMGEPAFNPAIIDVLNTLPERYHAPGLLPSLSTVAPQGTDAFFEALLQTKERLYGGGRFQMQFSIHTTDLAIRNRLIPIKTWEFDRIAAFGRQFVRPDDKKISLNFALAEGSPLDPGVLRRFFPPDLFLVKLTPVNPTIRALEHDIRGAIDPSRPPSAKVLRDRLQAHGYDVILSIGEVEENKIGSNCGQYVRRHLESGVPRDGAYEYPPVWP